MNIVKTITIKFILVSIFFVLLSSCSNDRGVQVLKLAHGLDTKHPVHLSMLHFAERLRQYSKGEMEVELYPSGQLGSERELIELIQIGSIDMTKVSASSLEPFIPETKIFSTPYLFRDSNHLWKVLNGSIGKELLNSGTPYRIQGLGYYDAGSRSFYSTKKPVHSPEDLKGMKIRVMNSPSAVAMVKAMGGSPTPISWGELYTSLQQGVVDGAENNLPSFFLSKHYEVAKYLILDEHTSIPDVVITGTKTWGRMTEQQKQWVAKAMSDSVTFERELWEKISQESLAAVKQAGVQVIEADKSIFLDSVKSIHDEIESSELGELFNRIREAR
ncbi:TRAP transporter substrate-binding protein [Gilvimarinus agarilyticus]|uniref:TRAP transporter substrate-binding protein n=1 Tax=Gilvimarinus sp. 2_MG-2023 TaxID=3062666 RepID=UPI001C0938C6|nr:TRAP transporter substrate-binding protein [Gilvimarinus sp. 2_MG-2023]MBU2886710.1 TRAP transporter substrate-binding protein [Gilvimarinus agarilyticus]MDO6571376.1 TRAP transporter substrate-binding protein [Gilvimarinus sp. 2_MG-2023]